MVNRIKITLIILKCSIKNLKGFLIIIKPLLLYIKYNILKVKIKEKINGKILPLNFKSNFHFLHLLKFTFGISAKKLHTRILLMINL